MKFFRILLFLYIITGSCTFAQSLPDSMEIKAFWNTHVPPLIKKDTALLSKLIEFPVSGMWGMFFMVDSLEEAWNKQWSKEAFLARIDKFIPQELIEALKKMNYKDVSIHTEIGFTELAFGYNRVILNAWESGEADEDSLIFIYKKIKGEWKLWSIQIAG